MTKNDFASAKSISFDKIPIIDISEIYTENGFEKVANELVQTARSIGFFYIKGHGVSLDLITQAFKASKMFFELPLEKKASLLLTKRYKRKSSMVIKLISIKTYTLSLPISVYLIANFVLTPEN